ncbi:hypothetical protein BUALT_Bualt01G0201200 [Buddleja alternifolia]|uniref:Uncharacterized protein n=1 Tax=Buddleja alternifolia TaxID=168488 RepID=A0AAV6Y9L0_9LAMI|nr:hypothetical protein BUALT_Bualt01G0201200 [Buddleja alternifolia]
MAECELFNALQNALSIRNAHIIKQILRKYGDITNGSLLKSIEAKVAFLQLVAEVVERLHSHTLGTIGAHEIQVLQKWTHDATAVGFHVKWLQERIEKIVAMSKHQDHLMRLNEINQRINAAKIALSEMERQQMILRKEIDSMMAKMDRDEFCRSNLYEGLL